jgi:phosphoglycolate phosphatase-like HAD superfamily hydrolase
MIEIIAKGAHAGAAKVVLFDFDGTLSLIRAGWVEVMVPMMVDLLVGTKSGESPEQLHEIVLEFVGRLTGKETIYQMMALADAIRERGGTPEEPIVYKKMYLDRLSHHIGHRLEALRSGRAAAREYLVPGSIALLDALKDRGLTLYLASGTDHADVVEEAKLLGIYDYFAGVFGALDDLKSFSKGLLIKRIIDSAEFRGHEFLGFGDGYVEIEEIKKVGGIAVGVATNEPECLNVDTCKRDRLVGVGADIIVPNYLNLDELLGAVFPHAHAIQI